MFLRKDRLQKHPSLEMKEKHKQLRDKLGGFPSSTPKAVLRNRKPEVVKVVKKGEGSE